MSVPDQRARADPSIPPANGSCKITKLPSEVHQNIFPDIANPSHLINIMTTCKDLKAPAEAILWKKCNIEGYARLLTLPADQQQSNRNKVRELIFDIRNTDLQPRDLQLHSPSLTRIRICHLSLDTLEMPVDVSNFVTSKMTEINIHNGVTDNFLPVLRRAGNF
ncbi:hypothetical protein KCU93_g4577, partial [Aureobasidium melanogenum]